MSSVDKSSKRRKVWRSLDELENSPEFRRFVEHEFTEPAMDTPPSSPERRRFMQLMGASFAFAGATGCRWEEDHILPHTRRPEGLTPGVPRYYSTAMELGGYGTGLRARSFEGRPIKIEGNPEHPDSRGAALVFHQASLLELYDPDRSRGLATYQGGQRIEQDEVELKKFIKPLASALRNRQGQGLRVLSESSSSPSLADMRRRLLEAFPQAKWYEYEPVSDDNIRQGSTLAFGAPYRPLPALDRAKVVLALDADFLGAEPMALRVARDFIEGRAPETGQMNRLYAIESAYTMTGGVADHRLPLRSELIKAVAVLLDASISAKTQPSEELGAAQPQPRAAFLSDPKVKKFLEVLEADLLAHRGQSVVLAGRQQPPEVHALAHRLNVLLGNVGQTISYVPDPIRERQPHIEAIGALAKEMSAGQVDTLLILGGNPVYNAPADLSFGSALEKVENSVHLSLFEDETSRKTTWHVPIAHYLETWGDVRGYDGTISIVQPLIAPLYGGMSSIEFLALVLGDSTKDGLDIVKRTMSRRIGDERLWRKAVHDGVVMGSAMTPVQPALNPLAPIALAENELGGMDAQNGRLELVLAPDSKLYDGRYANSGWLQELPDPMTKLTWDNAAIISPVTAKQLGIENRDVVTLSVGGNSITIPALVSPGQAPGSVGVALGYGRTAAGIIGTGSYLEHGPAPELTELLKEGKVEPVGVNAYVLRTTGLTTFGSGLEIKRTGKRSRLAVTEQTHAIKDEVGRHGIEDRLGELVRTATLEQYKQHPDFAQHAVHHPPLLSLWREPVSYDGHKWGMSIDLNRCIGCNACVTACQAENNIPVVGKERVLMGREMHWIRIDRYYSGDPADPGLAHQPVPCMQCENAPCEQVCPVGATMHSTEGLNDMVYNRCIGTRYCSNNCPYKVRRFNYFNMNEKMKLEKNQVMGMAFNPEVTVRFRGVMEKCTYCVQRIQNVKIQAKNQRRPIKDGEIQTACQQTCPTRAIVFGDLNDQQSHLSELLSRPRAYSMLQELNVRPRTRYLARVTNPHPELQPSTEHAHGEHGS